MAYARATIPEHAIDWHALTRWVADGLNRCYDGGPADTKADTWRIRRRGDTLDDEPHVGAVIDEHDDGSFTTVETVPVRVPIGTAAPA